MKNFKLFFLMAVLILLLISVFSCDNKNSSGNDDNSDTVDEFIVAVSTGTSYEEEANKYNKITEVKTYKDDTLTLQELKNKRVDGVITDRLVGLYGLKEGGFNDFELAGDLIFVETIAVAIHQDNDSLRQAINKALAEIIENGKYEEISTKYFGRNILEGMDYKITYPDEEEAKDDSLAKVKEKGEITFAMSGGYPPFNYFKDDELTGFDVEIGMEVAKVLGVEYKPITTDWSGIINGLRAGRYDGIFGSMAIKDDRKEVVDFTNPYYYSGAQLIVNKGSKIKSIEDLK